MTNFQVAADGTTYSHILLVCRTGYKSFLNKNYRVLVARRAPHSPSGRWTRSPPALSGLCTPGISLFLSLGFYFYNTVSVSMSRWPGIHRTAQCGLTPRPPRSVHRQSRCVPLSWPQQGLPYAFSGIHLTSLSSMLMQIKTERPVWRPHRLLLIP